VTSYSATQCAWPPAHLHLDYISLLHIFTTYLYYTPTSYSATQCAWPPAHLQSGCRTCWRSSAPGGATLLPGSPCRSLTHRHYIYGKRDLSCGKRDLSCGKRDIAYGKTLLPGSPCRSLTHRHSIYIIYRHYIYYIQKLYIYYILDPLAAP